MNDKQLEAAIKKSKGKLTLFSAYRKLEEENGRIHSASRQLLEEKLTLHADNEKLSNELEKFKRELNTALGSKYSPSKIESDMRRDFAALEDKLHKEEDKARLSWQDLTSSELEVRNLTLVVEGLVRVLSNNLNSKVRWSATRS